MKDGGPVFPEISGVYFKHGIHERQTLNCNNGMSLRDYFAAKAMQGFLSGFRSPAGIYSEDATSALNISKLSYDIADAMIEERENTEG